MSEHEQGRSKSLDELIKRAGQSLDDGACFEAERIAEKAVAAARTASRASSAPIVGMVPMTARAPVVALNTGELTSSVLPLHTAKRAACGVR